MTEKQALKRVTYTTGCHVKPDPAARLSSTEQGKFIQTRKIGTFLGATSFGHAVVIWEGWEKPEAVPFDYIQRARRRSK
jgi:hypothetical protein